MEASCLAGLAGKCKIRLLKNRIIAMILKKLNCLFICIGFAVSAFGAVKMPSIFSDNMMFQRDMPAPVWGEAFL